jgi:CBS domain-containing protein
MDPTAEALLQLTANDLMSREVVMLPKEMSLRVAAHLLAQNQISGAPVVDLEGRCIGVVSATDFMRWTEKGADAARGATAGAECHCAWQLLDVENLPLDQVGACMTRDPVMVSPQTSIVTVARHMLDAHIHRVVVADAQRRPIGVVSSTDLLAAIARTDPASPDRMAKTPALPNPAEPHAPSGRRSAQGPQYTTRHV